MEDFDDVLDDWFLQSLKTYKDLHVFQLEHPTRVIEWTSGTTVCVAGHHPSKNEVLELRLPLKLFADEYKGLCAERDFKVVHGGFSDLPVFCLRHIPGTRCVVTNDGRSSDLQVWDVGGDDTDVIRRTGSVEGRRTDLQRGSRVAARRSMNPDVLHGAQSNQLQLTQIHSGLTLYKLDTAPAEPLSSLQFLTDDVFLAGCCSGNVFIADVRSSAAPQVSVPAVSSADSVLWWTEGSAGPDPSGCRLLRVSSSGQALVSDLRRPDGTMCRAQLDVPTQCRRPDDVSVAWAPVRPDCISVSGFSGAVQIYDTSLWGAEPQEAPPLFEHHGHAVSSQQPADSVPISITAHVWHPDRPRTLLSAASDGSVHVWDWVDQSGDGETRSK